MPPTLWADTPFECLIIGAIPGLLAPIPPDLPLQGHKAIWQLAPPIPPAMLEQLVGLSPMLCHLLYGRGYRSTQEIIDFFRFGEQPHDPRLLPDIDRAVERIARAITRGEGVAIYGDFDCDGLTSAALLEEALHAYGLEPVIHIPSRDDGHGLHPAALVRLAEQQVELVITADCGVTALDEVDLASDLAIDIVVTDHHESRADGSLPDCPVVNPTRHDSLYPCRDLCGVGVAYKVVEALVAAIPGGSDPAELLDLVALGTVADVAPLRGENRWLVTEGLRRLQNTQRPGLAALFEVAGIERGRIDPMSIGYYLAPRVNAANRLATPELAYALLTAKDRPTAHLLAEELSEYNRRRQALVQLHIEEIVARVGDPTIVTDEVQKGVRPPALVEIGDWTAGISGLLASKLVDRYGIPAFVGSISSDGVVGVSARGIEGVYIDEILESSEAAVEGGLFIGYGGHARAGGFRVAAEQWELALSTLDEQIRRHVSLDIVGKTLLADAEVPLRKLTLSAARQIRTLAPFGQGFGEPLFLIRNVTLWRVRPVGAAGQHAKLTLQQGDDRIDAVLFNCDGDFFQLPVEARIDVLCHLQINEWRGSSKPELNLRDWRLAE